MSNELIAAWFWTKGTTELYPETAKAAIDQVANDELQDYWAHATGDGFDASNPDEVREVRDQLRNEIDEIATLMSSNTDGLVLSSPSGDTLWFAGGTSAGDDPNETFTAVSNILECPTVLSALRGQGDVRSGT